jgi:hypothetical protein
LGPDAQGRPIDRLALSPEEAAIILCILQLYADDYSLKAVCKILNADDIASPHVRKCGKYNAAT